MYIEREGSAITLEEWLDYINKDSELTPSAGRSAINPITKAKMTIRIPGRAIWNGNSELIYDKGRIRGMGGDIDGLIKKLSEIAEALSASVFDCGEKIFG